MESNKVLTAVGIVINHTNSQFLKKSHDVNQKKKKPTIFFEVMVSSSFNLQYQSMGIGSLSLLDEINLQWSLWGLF